MSNEGVIRIKGDTKELISSLEKAGVKFQQLGAHAEKAHGHAKSFGQAWEHANSNMVRTLAHAVSIGAAVHEAVHAIREFQTESQKAAKTIGDLGVRRERAAANLGISPEVSAGLVGGSSPLPRAEREGYFAELGDRDHVGRVKRRMTTQEVAQAQAAYNSGLYSKKEIDEAIDRGTLGSLNVGGRYNEMTRETREAYDASVAEQGYLELAEERNAIGGNSRRVGAARYQAQTAAYGVAGALLRNPVSTAAATEAEGSNYSKLSMWSATPEGGWESFREEIRKQTEELKPGPTVGGKAH